jgi:chromosome segregation ATPase
MSIDESLDLLERVKNLLQTAKTADDENKMKLTELTQKIDEMKNIVTQKDVELRNSEEEKNRLKAEIESARQEAEKYKQEITNKDDELNALRTEIDAIKSEKQRVEAEDTKMREEYLAVQEQLKKISTMYQELSSKHDEAIDVREVLSIYIILLEQVFQGRPHARILFMLHGDKTQLTRDEIAKAGGFQPAIVLKSIHDLAAADLVKYDMEQDIVELVRKIY